MPTLTSTGSIGAASPPGGGPVNAGAWAQGLDAYQPWCLASSAGIVGLYAGFSITNKDKPEDMDKVQHGEHRTLTDGVMVKAETAGRVVFQPAPPNFAPVSATAAFLLESHPGISQSENLPRGFDACSNPCFQMSQFLFPGGIQHCEHNAVTNVVSQA